MQRILQPVDHLGERHHPHLRAQRAVVVRQRVNLGLPACDQDSRGGRAWRIEQVEAAKAIDHRA